MAQRLGLIGAKVGEGPAHKLLADLLPPDWDAQQVYDHHEALVFHGQKCCYFSAPACPRCPVLAQCPFGQTRLGSSGGEYDIFGKLKTGYKSGRVFFEKSEIPLPVQLASSSSDPMLVLR